MAAFNNLVGNFNENKAVIIETGRSITYLELEQFSNQFLSLIPKRSLVFCLCKNNMETLIGYFSFIRNRVVPLMLEASLDKKLLANLLEKYSPMYIWTPKESVEQYTGFKIVFSYEGYSLLKWKSKKKLLINDELALLLTTSGSTGSPKLVRISYENLESNATSIAQYLSINENERPITTLPMNYSFGLSIINSHLIKGATILLTSKSLMEKEFWAFLKDQKATSMSGVPYTFEILKKLRFFRMDLPSLKTLTQAGGKLSNELIKEFTEFCQQSSNRFFVMYGQTEATARMSYLPPEYSLKKLGSMGIAIPKGEFSLIDENGITIDSHDIVGELVYKGKNVSLGYAECGLDLNKVDENRGVLYTGDLAKRDIDNFYYIVGRKKRFIKLFGNRVNLDETEQILKTIISDCACAGEDDHMKIYITDNDRLPEVSNFISSKLGIHYSAFSVVFIKEIPKNPSGKTIYNNLVTR
jgi:long-chain acyl-CoA synthetase